MCDTGVCIRMKTWFPEKGVRWGSALVEWTNMLPWEPGWIKLMVCGYISSLSFLSIYTDVGIKTNGTHLHTQTFQISGTLWVLVFSSCKNSDILAETQDLSPRRKTWMRTLLSEKMRINGCQSPCRISRQWTIKAAFPQHTHKKWELEVPDISVNCATMSSPQ